MVENHVSFAGMEPNRNKTTDIYISFSFLVSLFSVCSSIRIERSVERNDSILFTRLFVHVSFGIE